MAVEMRIGKRPKLKGNDKKEFLKNQKRVDMAKKEIGERARQGLPIGPEPRFFMKKIIRRLPEHAQSDHTIGK